MHTLSVSRKRETPREPPGVSARPGIMAAMTAPAAAPTWEPAVARREFARLVLDHGTEFTGLVVREPTGRARDSWALAWSAARATGHTYVEGLVAFRGRWAPHAFTVDGAGLVHEHCSGLDDTHTYRGLPLDTRPDGAPAALTASWGAHRDCIVQDAIGAGYDWDDVRTHLLAPGWGA